MASMFKFLLIMLWLTIYDHASAFEQVAPEICDNALDDDNDGLIDINDEDCICAPLEQLSLIPNPSFENQDCCPDGHSQLDCATGWEAASEGTPDYFHSCNYDGTFFNLPQPIPDGEGFTGIIDGSFAGKLIPELKEYLGSCLLEPLKIDTFYRLDFYTGFMDSKTSPDITIALFGTTDCSKLPFGIGNVAFGCPANSPDWIELGSVSLSGQNQWVRANIRFKASAEITAIAIGPSCDLRSSTNNTYHLLDQIILKESTEFDLGIQAIGEPCTDDFVLEVKEQQGHKYQWYKDGIAILNEVSESLHNPPGEGQYQIRLQNNEGCKISNSYSYSPPFSFVKSSETICAGENFDFYNNLVTDAGIYWDTITTMNNCEKIVRLELQVKANAETYISSKIFPNESIRIGPHLYTEPGEYQTTIPTSYGCDSIVHLNLEHYKLFIPNAFSPNADGFNDVFSINGNVDLKEIVSLEIFNRWGELIFQGENLNAGEGWDGTVDSENELPGVYTYITEIVMSDNKKRTLHGMVTLMR
jgi:gliding motility-associated-like protein